MAPEVLKAEYTNATDMWSVGVIAYMLLSGRMPFDSRSEHHVIQMIERAAYNFKGHAWQGKSEEAKGFITGLLKVGKHCVVFTRRRTLRWEPCETGASVVCALLRARPHNMHFRACDMLRVNTASLPPTTMRARLPHRAFLLFVSVD